MSQSDLKDGSETPVGILPGVWREMSVERRRPIRVKLSHSGRAGQGTQCFNGQTGLLINREQESGQPGLQPPAPAPAVTVTQS